MSEVVKVTLGDQTFDIPELPISVMRNIWPLTARMSERARAGGDMGSTLSKENIEDALELIYLGVSYGKPNFTRDDMGNIVADLQDIMDAAMIISIQAGGKRVGEKMKAMQSQQKAAPEA